MKTNTTNINIKITNREWKNKNMEYLKELEGFLDKVENIKDEQLKKEITFQMLKCDEKLTVLAEKNFVEFYKKGCKKCKGD